MTARSLRLVGKMLTVAVLFSLTSCRASTNAQESDAAAPDTSSYVPAPEARMSPMAVTTAMLDGDIYVKVVYSSPRKRGRTIFGGLVPFGEVWRTGANEATEITSTGPIVFGPQPLEAGTYALFTIPGEDAWTVIVNGGLGQWGAYDYDPAKDVVRFDVDVDVVPRVHEAFTVSLEDAGDEGAALRILWDTTQVVVPIRAG